MNRIPDGAAASAVDLIKKFEGCRLHAYPDPATGGEPWTIGYGATGTDSCGNPITKGTVWTQFKADTELQMAVAKRQERIVTLLTRPIRSHQLAAMTSLAYNIGPASFENSTVRRRFNDGDLQGAGDAFLLWNKAAGKVVIGLSNRRQAERAVFLKKG